MSRLSLVILFASILLIILGVMFEVPFVQGGSGVVLVVGLVYSYVVAKRELALLAYAVENREDERQ